MPCRLRGGDDVRKRLPSSVLGNVSSLMPASWAQLAASLAHAGIACDVRTLPFERGVDTCGLGEMRVFMRRIMSQ